MNDSERGRVYIVGAGPGDPRLITCRGAECLRQADAVLYDELLDRRLLDLTAPDCEHIYVGKRGGRREARTDGQRIACCPEPEPPYRAPTSVHTPTER